MAETVMDWFDLNQRFDDLENVLNFIESVPDKLENLFDRESFRNLLDADAEFEISSDLFFSVLSDAKGQLIFEVEYLRGRTLSEAYYNYSLQILNRIGFSGNALKLKARILNKLWNDVVTTANNSIEGVITFASNPIVRLTRKFLNYLNSLLGSLSNLIPGVDGIKEIKEIGENYLSIADEQL